MQLKSSSLHSHALFSILSNTNLSTSDVKKCIIFFWLKIMANLSKEVGIKKKKILPQVTHILES
jgi:hypothetical protein